MFQRISALAARIEKIINRTQYVFELVSWGAETLRVIADRLRCFPKPANEEKEENISKPVAGSTPGDSKQQPGEPENKPLEVAGENNANG